MTYTSKDKINAMHFSGSIGIAIIVAALTGSVSMFFIVAAALIAASVFSNEIRPPQRRRG